MDISTVQNVIDYANMKLQGNGNINPTDGLKFVNDANLDLHKEFINRGVKASELQEAYRDVTVPATGQGSTFLYPSDMLLLKQITVNFTDTTQQNYVVCEQIDTGNTDENISFEFLRQNQSTDIPQFDDRGDWFEVFPTFTAAMNLTQAIRILYYLKPAVYTSTANTLNYPEANEPYALVDKVLNIYYASLENTTMAQTFQDSYTNQVKRAVKTLAKGADRPINSESVGLTGWEF